MDKNKIDNELPGDWTSVDASELFALFVLTLILILSAIDGLKVSDPIIRETIFVCLTVLFGSQYIKREK